jgi:hypothetical protein
VITQENVNWDDPKQHFVWGLRNLPTFAGVGAVTHPGFLEQWSEHLFQAGFRHVDYLRSLADGDGNIAVSDLPVQQIKWQPPTRGPRNLWNPAARWVSAYTPDPEPMRIPDINLLTDPEREALLAQFRDHGLIPDPQPAYDTGGVE